MAQLGNLIVTGESRLLNKVYCNDALTVTGTTALKGRTEVGTIYIGNSLYLNGGYASFDGTVLCKQSIYFGKSLEQATANIYYTYDNETLHLDAEIDMAYNVNVCGGLTVADNIKSSLVQTNSLTATNATITNTLKAYKYEAYTIQNLGGEFIVAPTLYIQKTASIKAQASTNNRSLTIKITDSSSITSDKIQGVRWTEGSLIKFMGKINGIAINFEGTLNANLNTETNVMSLTLAVDADIGSAFPQTLTSVTSFSDVSVMMYRIKGVNASGTSTYTPLGIRLSTSGTQSDGSDYAHIDIWGTKSGTSSDTLLSAPNVRLGYLLGLPNLANGITPGGWGLYADNAFLKGAIVASSGTIGGFTINNYMLYNGTIGASGSVYASIGVASTANIGNSGATSHTWAFTAGSTFGVTTAGALYASNANITGTITANNGKIGVFTISNTTTDAWGLYATSDDTKSSVSIRKPINYSSTKYNYPFCLNADNKDKIRVTSYGRLEFLNSGDIQVADSFYAGPSNAYFNVTTNFSKDITRNGIALGTCYNGSSSGVSIASGDWYATGSSITIPAGAYVIVGTVAFGSAKGGRRFARLLIDNSVYSQCVNSTAALESKSGNFTVQVTWIQKWSDSKTIKLEAYQSSGSALSVGSYLRAMRIM